MDIKQSIKEFFAGLPVFSMFMRYEHDATFQAEASDIAVTFCTDCIYHKINYDGPRTNCWYNNFCKAVPHQEKIDPVSKKKMFVNSYGVLVEHPFAYCRDINNGNCPLFSSKEDEDYEPSSIR